MIQGPQWKLGFTAVAQVGDDGVFGLGGRTEQLDARHVNKAVDRPDLGYGRESQHCPGLSSVSICEAGLVSCWDVNGGQVWERNC